jgi:hypothetical protein
MWLVPWQYKHVRVKCWPSKRSLGRSPLGELFISESLGCPPSGVGDQNVWVHKLVN